MVREIFLCGLSFFIWVTLVSSSGCAKTVELSSRWLDREIVVDGEGEEWGSATLYIPEAKVALTLFNDGDFMYIRMHTRDREVQAQVIRGGLTVWFDPAGGKNEALGIHYPMGMSLDDSLPPPQFMIRDSQDMLEQMLENLPDELEILRSGYESGDTFSAAAARIAGIDVDLGFVKGNFIYELKIPFRENKQHPLAIGLSEPSTDASPAIGIGFETAKIDMSAVKEMMPEGKPMMGSGMSAGPPGGRGMPDPLKLWVSVTLAEE